MERLFLSPESGIAVHRLSIVCNRVLGRDQISSRKAGAQELLPNRTGIRGKYRCTRHLRRIRPSRRQHWFRVCHVSQVVLRVPKLYVRCVLQQSVGSFENQGLSAKAHLFIIRENGNISVSDFKLQV